MKIFRSILFLLILINIYSCSTISPKTPVIIGPHIIDTTGAVKEVHPVQTLSVVGLYKLAINKPLNYQVWLILTLELTPLMLL